jgi:HSP20 family molecular chaperone IbpA
MSLFPRFTQEFSPLFRLFDEYERQAFRHVDQNIRSFSPKFDVKELPDAYELHGEFPGIEQKNINIEWTDGNTLTISGRHETVKEEGTKPQALLEGTEKKDEHYHKPTVEDEDGETLHDTQVAKKPEQEVARQTDNDAKFWVSERSVGEFHRSFAFPARIDQEAVKASLKNGILSIVVPKAKAPQPRKINIE